MYGCTFVQTKSITVTGIVSYRNTLDFDGTNDYLTVPDNNALDLTTNYTLEAWVKADGFNWLGGIISKYNSNGSNGYVLRSNQVSPYTGLGFDGQETANGVLQLGVWHHIAAVKEGNSRKLYVDGTEVALTSGYSHTVSANSDPLIIGKDFLYQTNSRYWNGKIDEIRIWNIAKTQAQVQALKDNELVGNESGLVLYYNFNQGTAGGNNSSILSVLDGTSAARNASIVNFDKSGSNSNFIANDNGPVIVGPSAVCVGLTATYTNRTTGGTWGTSNSSIFTVSTSGVLTAIAAGTADLTYTFTSNNCTFTVSNLGMFGITEFTSIINQPNSAILSVGAIIEKPVVRNGQIVVGNTMKVTLACDHRTVDGATGSEFLQTLRTYLENPVTMLA